MTGPTGLLDFYVLEASEYLDQMDALLASSSRGVPDTGAFLTSARALRGSSTMARLPHLADLAGAIERVARTVREGALGWSESVRATLISAVDDFRILLRAVRAWTPDDEQRVVQRIAELRPLITGGPPSADVAVPPDTGAANAPFFATEIEAIASSLDAFRSNPRDPRPLDQALARVRALRGIAALKDFPPLNDVTDAIERAASVRHDASNAGEQRSNVFHAATTLLTRAAGELRSSGRIDPASPELARFVETTTALDARLAEQEPVVPIARLFFADGGPHVVATTPAPVPGAAEVRFRTEIITHAEHLRRLVADARSVTDIAARERASRELRGGLRAVRQLAESFGFGDVARFFNTSAGDDEILHPVLLASLDDAAVLLTSEATPTAELRHRLETLQRGRVVDREIGTGFEPLEHARRVTPEPGAVTRPSPSAPREAVPTPPAAVFTPAPIAATPPSSPAIASAPAVVPPRPATPAPTPTIAAAPPRPTPPRADSYPTRPPTPPVTRAMPPMPTAPSPASAGGSPFTPPSSPSAPSPRSVPAVGDVPQRAPAVAQRAPTPPFGSASPAPNPFESVRRTPARSYSVSGRRSPSGRELRELLQSGIAGLRPLEESPLSAPASLEEAALIPIEALVYRGRAALARALELRDAIQAEGTEAEPLLAELFDLLELASRD